MTSKTDPFGNDYGQLVEAWKVKLIVDRAKRLGIPQQEWPDVQQEIIFDVMDFRFDPAKSNGAKESTLLITIIDNRLKKILRATARNGHRVNEPKSEVSEDKTALRLDVRRAVASLTFRQEAVCMHLSQGKSTTQIAWAMDCGRATVRRFKERIREQFENIGLDGWVHR